MAQNIRRIKRKERIRKIVHGTPQRPRLSIYKSNTAVYLQLIDDTTGTTLLATDTRKFGGKNKEAAVKAAENFALQATQKGVEAICFDRSGYLYHGVVKAISQTVSNKGLKH